MDLQLSEVFGSTRLIMHFGGHARNDMHIILNGLLDRIHEGRAISLNTPALILTHTLVRNKDQVVGFLKSQESPNSFLDVPTNDAPMLKLSSLGHLVHVVSIE